MKRALYSRGLNMFGQLGYESNFEQWKFQQIPFSGEPISLCCKYCHNLVLSSSNTLYSWGWPIDYAEFMFKNLLYYYFLQALYKPYYVSHSCRNYLNLKK
jgi:hypothetical protein